MIDIGDWLRVRTRLKAERVKQGLDLQEVAAQLDVAGGTVGNWERGSSIPSITAFASWCHALGMDAVMLEPGDWRWVGGDYRRGGA